MTAPSAQDRPGRTGAPRARRNGRRAGPASPRLPGVLCAAFALALSLTPGPTFAEDVMESTYNNTIRIEGTDGTVTKFFYNPDGTYFATDTSHGTWKGTWEVYGSLLCTTPENGVQTCTEWKSRKVGASWTEPGVDGDPLQLSIVEGR